MYLLCVYVCVCVQVRSFNEVPMHIIYQLENVVQYRPYVIRTNIRT